MGKGKAWTKYQRPTTAGPLEDLEHQPTKILLAELRRMRVAATQYEVAAWTGLNYDQDGAHHRARAHDEQYVAALKAELAKRPHVPNKQEARAIRQAKAKEQRAR